MNKIDEMIRELCPEGVKMVKLGEVCEIKTGKGITQNDANEGGEFPIISGGITPMGMFHVANRKAFTVTISRVGANAGYVNYIKTDFYLNDKCFSVIPVCDGINTDYLYVIVKYKEQFIRSLQSEGGVPTINTQKVGNVEIPLPPLAIQQEIVLILDSFSSLQSKLEEELAVRQKQMEFYREKLLTFDKDDNSVKWMKLGEVCEIKNGKDYKHLNSGNIPVWGTGGIMCYVDKYAYDKPSVLLPRKGSIDKSYYTEEPFWTVDTLFYTIINEDIVFPKYLYVYIQSIDLSKLNTSVGNRPSLTQGVLNSLSVPVPPLSRQQEIVSTLDTMSSLIDKLKEEIELRKKQYEYYREALLSF